MIEIIAAASRRPYEPNDQYHSGQNNFLCQCDELEERGFFRPVPTELPQGTLVAASDTKRYQGLCSDCEERTQCNIPRRFGGVWECTSYH
jgi:hypothetical protein